MDVPMLADQQDLIYINSERIQDVIWKICQERWMDGERERVWEICASENAEWVFGM